VSLTLLLGVSLVAGAAEATPVDRVLAPIGSTERPAGPIANEADLRTLLEQVSRRAEVSKQNAGPASPVCLAVPNRNDRCPRWVQAYTNGGGHSLGCAGQEYPQWSGANQTTIFVTGFTCQRTSTDLDFQTVAYSASTGALKWVATYDGPQHVIEVPSGLAVGPGGQTIYVTGLRDWRENGTGDLVTIAYRASDGALLWVSSYAGPAQGTDWGLSAAVSGDGSRVYVTGRTEETPTGPNDFLTISYVAATGQKDWVAIHSGPGPDDIPLAVGSRGANVYVTGSTAPIGLGLRQLHTVGYFDDRSQHQGTELWAATFTGVPPVNPFDNRPLSGYIGTRGPNVIVAGTTQNELKQEWVTLAYEPSTGALRWFQRYHGTSGTGGQALALAMSPTGDAAYVAGWAAGSRRPGQCGLVACHRDADTVAYDSATGARRWVSHYTGVGVVSLATAFAVATSPDGSRVYVAGGLDYSYLNATLALKADALTVALDASTGRQLWASLYNDRPAAVSPAGVLELDLVYLVGTTSDGETVFSAGSFIRQVPKAGVNFWDFGTLAFDP
jgi:DNA-binding beta-propeller fold protein YncE